MQRFEPDAHFEPAVEPAVVINGPALAPKSGWARVRAQLFSISPAEATFARRGFRSRSREQQMRLERAGETFIAGYNTALTTAEPAELSIELSRIENEYRGFAYEGAAMSLSLLDELMPGRRRFARLLDGPARDHIYMLHVGIGWTYARLPWCKYRIASAIRRLDPLLRWLAVDGYGFHHGYFEWPASVAQQRVPRGVEGYALRAFDQGLGRSAWFGCGGDPDEMAVLIRRFPRQRQSDLWSGAGLACAYAGALDAAGILALLRSAGEDHAHFRQGVAFAAKARQLAGNPARHTEMAANVACGCSAEAAAALTDRCLAAQRPSAAEPVYECWRRQIRQDIVRTYIEHHEEILT